jgi:non-ribosomal peptide synthetase component F
LHQHQGLSFEKLVEALKPERSLSHAPLFQVSFGYNTTFTPRADDEGGLRVELMRTPGEVAKYDLTVSLAPDGDGIWGYWEYSSDLFDENTIEGMAERYTLLLKALVAEADRRIGQIDVRDARDAAALVNGSGETHAHGIGDVAAAVVARAQERPDAIAVRYHGRELNYASLVETAGCLAAELIERGIVTEDRVALCMDRTEWLPMAMLAVVMAGAAYVPIDPRAPAQRRATILIDSGAKLLLGCGDAGEREGHEVEVLDVARWASQRDPQRLPLSPASPPQQQLAYVVYTSGTTGTPKGVAVGPEV